jgi:hypothetical protein
MKLSYAVRFFSPDLEIDYQYVVGDQKCVRVNIVPDFCLSSAGYFQHLHFAYLTNSVLLKLRVSCQINNISDSTKLL